MSFYRIKSINEKTKVDKESGITLYFWKFKFEKEDILDQENVKENSNFVLTVSVDIHDVIDSILKNIQHQNQFTYQDIEKYNQMITDYFTKLNDLQEGSNPDWGKDPD